jgi:hypothetical protein
MKEASLKSYLKILEIRRSAARRNMLLTGTIFILSLLALFAFGMLGHLESLELYLITPILIAFALGFITSQIKYETTKSVIALGFELVQGEEIS